jgi:hypothetical protein
VEKQMLNFYEIFKAYKETGLYNYTIECLNSSNEFEKSFAMNTLAKQNFKTTNDVKMYVAMNI